jgi:hypothetical protein
MVCPPEAGARRPNVLSNYGVLSSNSRITRTLDDCVEGTYIYVTNTETDFGGSEKTRT